MFRVIFLIISFFVIINANEVNKKTTQKLTPKEIVEKYPDNRKKVLEAVKDDGLSIRFASEKLKKDKEIVISAMRQISQIPLNLRVFKKSVLEYVDKSFRKDKEVVLLALQNHGGALKYADIILRKDIEVVTKALKNDLRSMEFVDNTLRNNKSFILKGISDFGIGLEYIGETLLDDKDVVIAAVNSNGYNLKRVNSRFKNNKKVVMMALRTSGVAYDFVGDKLKNDKDVVLLALKDSWFVYKKLNEKFKNDKDVIIETINSLKSTLIRKDIPYSIMSREKKEKIAFSSIVYLSNKIADYNSAIIYSKKLLENYVEKYGKDNNQVATKYDEISLLYKKMENYNEALKYNIEAMKIRERIFDKNDINLAMSYNNVGLAYKRLDRYKLALKYYRKSLEIRQRVLGEKHLDTVQSYNNIAGVYMVYGRNKEALTYLNKVLNIKRQLLGEKSISLAITYNNLGTIYSELDKKQKAIVSYEKALKIYQNSFAENKEDIALSYNNLGTAYLKNGDYKKALNYFNKALSINKSIYNHEHIDIALSYSNLAFLYEELVDPLKAIEYYEKALEITINILGEKHSETSRLYNNLSLLYYYSYETEKALEYLNKSLSIDVKIYGEDGIPVSTIYNNIALIYYGQGKYEQSLNYTLKALLILEKNENLVDSFLVTTYNNIAMIYKGLKEDSKSLEYINKSIVVAERIYDKDNSTLGITYGNISLIYSELDDHPNAYKYAKNSFDIFLKNRDKNFAILDSKQKLQYVKANSDKLSALLNASTLYQEQLIKEGKKEEAQKIKEETLNNWLNYKGAIFDSENSLSILYEKVKDKEVKEKIEDLNSYKQQLSKLYQTIPKPDERESYKQRIETLETNISENEIYLSSKLDEFKEEIGLRKITYKDISSKLKEDEIYIDFAKTDDNYFVFTLDNKNTITFEKIKSETTKAINTNVKTFRENIDTLLKSTDLTKERLASLNKDAKTVLGKLNSDIVENLSNTVDHIKTKDTLIFSLDGVLNFLPFEALYDKTTNKYLIEKKNIKYVPSGKEFVRLLNKKEKSTKNSKDVTMFTNPDYGLKLPPSKNKDVLYTPNTRAGSFLHKSLFSMIFKPLPGTIEEAKLISTLYTNAKDYNQEEATSDNLFKVNSPKILHISTHGFFLNDENIKNPMLKAGLAFSGANMARVRGDSQGVVTGLKLAGLNLTNTDLVVLSACETGLGDVNEAEGVAGLNKAFIKAGAKNIVMSLWSVADKETAELMKGFYTNIKNSNNYQQSLKDSKLKMIKDDLHPFYWSAFILSGV